MKRFLAILVLVFLVGCKSKSVVVDANKPMTQITSKMTANKIIENYSNNKIDFSTLYIKSNVEYW
jgi:uncharacterized lipoprotein YehR (DUF1307 family)